MHALSHPRYGGALKAGALSLPLLIVQATKLRDVARRRLVVQGDELRQETFFVNHVSKTEKVVLPLKN